MRPFKNVIGQLQKWLLLMCGVKLIAFQFQPPNELFDVDLVWSLLVKDTWMRLDKLYK